MDSNDSLLGANQIQGCFWGGSLGCDGAVGFERRGVGANGSTGRDNRMFVEGVLWVVRTGSPWRDRPEVFSALRRSSKNTVLYCAGC